MVLTPKEFSLDGSETKEIIVELMISNLKQKKEKWEWIMIKGDFFD